MPATASASRPPTNGDSVDLEPQGTRLEVNGVNMSFGPQQVLHDAALTVRSGEVHALVGHNGSGKSTLVKVLAGLHAPAPGAVVRAGDEPVAPGDPQAAHDAGLHFVHQDLGLVDTLDVVDNVLFGGAYPRRRFGRIDGKAARRAVAAVLDDLGYGIDVRSSVARLSLADRTGVALARALYEPRGEATVVVFDETTAALPAPGVDRLFQAIRRLVARGLGVVYISHRLEEVFRIADRVTVLRDGRVVAVEEVAALSERQLIELMVGRGFDRSAGRREPPSRRPAVLSVRSLHGGRIRHADLTVHEGEIVGVAGLDDSGRNDFAPALFGFVPRQGDVAVHGVPVPAGRPDLAIRAGLGLLPSDRLRNGLFHRMSLRENLTMPAIPVRFRGGPLDRKAEAAATANWLDRLDVRPRRPDLPVAALSGGNQQKLLLARWLRLEPEVLVLDEPTQGVDVGAVERIYAMLRRSADQGMAVVVCSSDADELDLLCDRVVVFGGGVVRTELAGEDARRHAIDAAVLSGSGGNGS
jgi:ribose transport system ATP-binding protein